LQKVLSHLCEGTSSPKTQRGHVACVPRKQEGPRRGEARREKRAFRRNHHQGSRDQGWPWLGEQRQLTRGEPLGQQRKDKKARLFAVEKRRTFTRFGNIEGLLNRERDKNKRKRSLRGGETTGRSGCYDLKQENFHQKTPL